LDVKTEIQSVSESLSLNLSIKCPICGTKQIKTIAGDFELLYCQNCGLYSKDEKTFLNPIDEFKRYDQHSSIGDEHYKSFMNEFVLTAVFPFVNQGIAIDYGAGKTGVIKSILEASGFKCESYDPYFDKDKSTLNQTYDLLVSTEVVEHFQAIMLEWKKMVDLVKPNGFIAIMTQFAKEDLGNWWYLRDQTHYHFYQQRTFDYIAKTLGLSVVLNDGKTKVVFQKK